MKPRGLVALLIVAAWLAGAGMMLRRELSKPHIDRLAEAALRVSPGAVFYAVMQGDRQVGFASSTVDTAATSIEQRDYFVTDLPSGGQMRRSTARTNVVLTRTLRVRTFETEVDTSDRPLKVQGEIVGDSAIKVVVNPVAGQPADTQRYAIGGPVLLPTLMPLAVALEATPKVGKSVVLPVFDPQKRASSDVRIRVEAETTFVLNDSSVFDSTSGMWRGVLPDTVRAWRLVPETGDAVPAWVDAQGRVVSTRQMGFELRRLPYEVAFENWRREPEAKGGGAAAVTARASSNPDIFETTALAAGKVVSSSMQTFRAVLSGTGAGFELDGGRQVLRWDTLTVTREPAENLAARYFPLVNIDERARNPLVRKDAFLEVDHPEIMALAERLTDRSRDPRVIAERITRWVYDSVKKEVTGGIPSALHVLHTRTGDANEHTQLFTALARAAGVPTRMAAGLVYVNGKFYYHAWPEVQLRGWVAVDPTFGQFPADASHIRFVTGGAGRQADLLRAVGRLRIKVITAR